MWEVSGRVTTGLDYYALPCIIISLQLGEENSLPCFNKCGHLELKDVVGEEMKMTPSSTTGMDGAPQSSGISSGIQSCKCTYSELKK